MKKIISKTISVILALSMMLSAVPAVFAETSSTAGANAEANTEETVANDNSVYATSSSGASSSAASATSLRDNNAAADSDTPSVDNTKSIYITNYAVVDARGNTISKLTPGSSGIIAVTVVDERVPAELLDVASGTITGQIHATMTQGSFSCSNSQVRMRAPVGGHICYTVEFRNCTYVGGDNTLSFSVGYSAENGAYEKVPFAVEQKVLSLSIAQAVDDVPAPNIILTNSSSGSVSRGSTFTLSTTAMNTSDSLSLDNVTVKLVLPTGLSIASGNSQYLIGSVAKRGTISQTFTLKADSITTDTASMPITVEYTFEALVNGKRTTYTSDQQISVTVTQPTRFEISSLDVDESMTTDDTGYATVTLVNKGKSTISNVTAELVSDDLTGRDVEFIGNMAAGTQNEAEFSFNAAQSGTAKGKIVVTYEDSTGNESTLEKEFEIEVSDPIYIEPVYDEPVEEETTNNTGLYIGVGAAVAAVAAAVVIFKKKKAKRLAELEDEDEDI